MHPFNNVRVSFRNYSQFFFFIRFYRNHHFNYPLFFKKHIHLSWSHMFDCDMCSTHFKSRWYIDRIQKTSMTDCKLNAISLSNSCWKSNKPHSIQRWVELKAKVFNRNQGPIHWTSARCFSFTFLFVLSNMTKFYEW